MIFIVSYFILKLCWFQWSIVIFSCQIIVLLAVWCQLNFWLTCAVAISHIMEGFIVHIWNLQCSAGKCWSPLGQKMEASLFLLFSIAEVCNSSLSGRENSVQQLLASLSSGQLACHNHFSSPRGLQISYTCRCDTPVGPSRGLALKKWLII